MDLPDDRGVLRGNGATRRDPTDKGTGVEAAARRVTDDADAAAFLALSSERVWIELSGLPPSRLREYYARHRWDRLVRRMIFGTDWPGVPGIAGNARAVAALCPDEETAGLVLAGNAARVYTLKLGG